MKNEITNKICPECRKIVLRREILSAEQSGYCPVILICDECGYDITESEIPPA